MPYKQIKKAICVPNTTIVLKIVQVLVICLIQSSLLFSQNSNRSYKITFSDTIPGFTSIQAKGNVVISIRQDNYFSITFKGSRNILKDVFSSVKVNNHCLNIDATKLFENERIYVEVIMPVVDTIRLFDNASVYTPTNIWIKRLYIENYSEQRSEIFINSTECNLFTKGYGTIRLAGIVDILRVYAKDEIVLNIEFLSKYLYCETNQKATIIAKGKTFAGEFWAYNKSLIDAMETTCGRVKVFALDNSQINVKSEEKPLVLSLKKGKIQYIAPNVMVIDSIGIHNLKEIK
ncbi:MAG: DUF2807 domain-containing protein [Bacteroidales bacterium]|nr:DUF2807 domain-containing protein [Bacteroidales bacterium]